MPSATYSKTAKKIKRPVSGNGGSTNFFSFIGTCRGDLDPKDPLKEKWKTWWTSEAVLYFDRMYSNNLLSCGVNSSWLTETARARHSKLVNLRCILIEDIAIVYCLVELIAVNPLKQRGPVILWDQLSACGYCHCIGDQRCVSRLLIIRNLIICDKPK